MNYVPDTFLIDALSLKIDFILVRLFNDSRRLKELAVAIYTKNYSLLF